MLGDDYSTPLSASRLARFLRGMRLGISESIGVGDPKKVNTPWKPGSSIKAISAL
jgi:hypothetical protein